MWVQISLPTSSPFHRSRVTLQEAGEKNPIMVCARRLSTFTYLFTHSFIHSTNDLVPTSLQALCHALDSTGPYGCGFHFSQGERSSSFLGRLLPVSKGPQAATPRGATTHRGPVRPRGHEQSPRAPAPVPAPGPALCSPSA